jgi:hypothetical protein
MVVQVFEIEEGGVVVRPDTAEGLAPEVEKVAVSVIVHLPIVETLVPDAADHPLEVAQMILAIVPWKVEEKLRIVRMVPSTGKSLVQTGQTVAVKMVVDQMAYVL